MKELYILKSDLNKWIAKYFPNQDLISVEELVGVIEELDEKLEKTETEFEEYKQNVDENYQPISYASQIDYNPNDFH